MTLAHARRRVTSGVKSVMCLQVRTIGGRGRPRSSLALAVVTGCTAVAGGVIGYSLVDPKFRSTIEMNLPMTKGLYKAALGDSSSSSSRLSSPTLNGSTLVSPFPLKPKPSTSEIKESEKITSSSKPAVAKDKSSATEKTDTIDRTSTINKVKTVAKSDDTTSVKMSELPQKKSAAKPQNPYVGKDQSEKKNRELDASLKAAIASAELMVKKATSAKLSTIRAVEYHIQTIREAIEAGPTGDWDAVVAAHAAAERSTREDMAAEADGRIYIDNLKKLINQGGQGETTVLNPLLAISRETAGKLSTEMDEMGAMIKKIDTERVFVRDYGHLVEEGRQKFATELRAVMPDADFSGDIKDLKKGQLSALLVHAHLRVDQLRQQLIDRKLSEESRIRQAIEDMKAKKVAAVKEAPNVAVTTQTKQIDEIRAEFEKKLEGEIAEIEKKYDAKLQEVVLTQKQLYDIEHAKDVETAVLAERSVHAASIGRALSQLEGIEAALTNRSVQDAENRRAKQLWLAAHNLVESIEYGKKGKCCMEGRRLPLGPQMKVLMQHADGDEFMDTVSNAMDKTTRVRGEYTKDDLTTRVEKTIRVGHRVAALDDNGGGVIRHLTSWLQSCLRLRLPVKYNESDKFDPKTTSNADLLDRAQYFMRGGRILEAVKLLQATSGPTRRLASDVINDSRRHEESLMLARLILAHAAVTSIRTTY